MRICPYTCAQKIDQVIKLLSVSRLSHRPFQIHSSMSRSSVEPEVHVIGEISGGFFPTVTNAYCCYSVQSGSEWNLVGGESSGQTQCDYSTYPSLFAMTAASAALLSQPASLVVFNHPLDLHFYSKSSLGWPQVVVRCHTLDSYGSAQLIGYGTTYLPNSSGEHEIEIDIWRPIGNAKEEILDFYLGGSPILTQEEVIWNTASAKEDRCHLVTKPMGKVYLNLQVVLRNWQQHQIDQAAQQSSS